MKLIIAGSRNHKPLLTEIQLAFASLRDCDSALIEEVVSGGAAGVDAAGEEWARVREIPVKRFDADWAKYGKGAGPLRNLEMAKYADAAIVFWKGMSSGSANMIALMVMMKKPVLVVPA